MGVGMTGIEVVDGNPVETRIEIMLHLRDQVANEGLQIGDLAAVLGSDDKSELMRIVLRALKERGDVSMVITGCIGLSGLALACDAIAEDVINRARRSRCPRPASS
jgi:hypothetical protein